MSPELDRLIRLQDVETRALNAQRRITSAPVRIGELDAKLTAANNAVAAATQALADNQAGRRTLEKDQLAVQQRLSKYKEQLMEVKTNHEYHAMQQQMAATETELGRVEEAILVNMMAADEVNAALKTAQAKLKEDEANIKRERGEIETDAKTAEKEIAESAAERATLVAAMDRNNVTMFERVFKARQGYAVAEFAGGICTACRVRLRPMIYDQVRRNEDVVQCDYCQRILYYVPPKVEPASSVAPTTPPQ